MAFTDGIPSTAGVAQTQISQMSSCFAALRNLEYSSSIPANSTVGQLWHTATAGNASTFQDAAVYMKNSSGTWTLLFREEQLPVLGSSADAQGSLLSYTATGWETLPPAASANMVLASKGAGANCTWVNANGFEFIDTTGTGQFTVPAGVDDLYVTVIAGGGGGGSNGICGGGGSGQNKFVHLTGKASCTINYAVGGAGAAGAAGQNSSFTTVTCTAGGGGGTPAAGSPDWNGKTARNGASTGGGFGGYAGFSGDAGQPSAGAGGSSASGYGNGGAGASSAASGGGAGSQGCILIRW